MFDGKNIQEVDIDKIASIRRNPILADIFSRLDYMERRGSGLKRIKDSFIDESLVEFYSNESAFYVIMKKQYQAQEAYHQKEPNNEPFELFNEPFMSHLSDSEKAIVSYMFQHTRITAKEAEKITDLSRSQVKRLFVALQEKSIILAQGEGRSRHYILKSYK